MQNKSKIFDIRENSIMDICGEDFTFVIPVYQRPYIWDHIQINKLLEDLKENYILDKEYYVGNVYVTKRDSEGNNFDVIDGQQRFTTFWLISLYFNNKRNHALNKFIKTELNKIRLDFEIRHEVINYLNDLVNENKSFHEENLDNVEFLKNIFSGIKTIKAFFDEKENQKIAYEMQNYIYEKVKFIFNIAPRHTDLNSLFTTLGNSGQQLEQSDILKARLLNKLSSQRFQYAKIWEACENLNNYFEKNVIEIFSCDRSQISVESFKEYNSGLYLLAGESGVMDEKFRSGKSISSILSGEFADNVANEQKFYDNKCRSILNFNSLLLHTYRIYKLKKAEGDIEVFDPKKLLEIFHDFVDKSGDKEIKLFFELLWKVRYVFDMYVIKWRIPNTELSESNDEHLLLTDLNKQKDNSFARLNQKFSPIQMLQSVLYFNSGFAQQYWLTPYLNYLLEDNNPSDKDLLQVLEDIDNYMLPGNKKYSSWNYNKDKNLHKSFNVESHLSANAGTGFEHYWFYKLEYLIWKDWKKRDDPKFLNYRITSKNSVEHVFPQNDEYGRKLETTQIDDSLLDSFGNLVLLSVGQNSSYGNQSVGKKKIDFTNKLTYDSLKLYTIFSSFDDESEWNNSKIKSHRKAEMKILSDHYEKK